MAKETITIATEPRERTGTRYADRLRKSGRLPAVVYGLQLAPTHVSVDERELLNHLHMGARVIELQGSNGTDTCLVKDLQFGYLGDNVIHVDFARVNLNQVVTVNVPINTFGSPKLASEPGAMLETIRNEIEVECMVSQIPTEILIDLTDMGEALTVADLPLPDGVKPMLDADKHIVHITFVKEEEAEGEEASVDADGSEPEVITEKKEDDEPKAEGGDEG
jgi:large subunit ribosomal protein L25